MGTLQTEVLYGIHPVTEALSARRRRIFNIYLLPEKRTHWKVSLRERAHREGIPLTEMPLPDLNHLAKSPLTQGVAARVGPYPTIEAGEMLEKGSYIDEPPFFLLADGVMDPGNLGALIRTGMCAGVTGVVIPKDRCAPPTPAVSRASAGALEHIRLARVTNLVDAIRWLKKKSVWVYGLDPAANESIFSTDLSGAIALVVGGEEKGIRPLVKRHCDALVHIPQKGRLNSLNVSVAGGIAMYTVFRQRMNGHPE